MTLEKTASNYKSRVFLVLWTVNFLITFAVALIPTPRAYLAKEFVGNVETATMEAFGIMLSLGSAAATLGYFSGGFAADAVGKKRVVIASFILLATGCALFAVAPNLYFLYLASFIEFFASGFSSPAISALVADCSEQCSRGTTYGVFNLSWITAQVPAPLLAGFITQFVNLRAPFLMAVFVSVAGLFFSFLMKGKNVENKKEDKNDGLTVDASVSDHNAATKRVVLIFSITNLLNGLLNGFVGPLINGLLMFKLEAAPSEYGMVLSLASALVTGIVQIPGGKLTDKFGRKPLVLFSFLAVPLVLLIGFSQSLLGFGLIMGGISAVGNISSPAISAWLMDLIPEQKRARVAGITQTLNGVGLTAGPTAGSYVWNSTKPEAFTSCGIAALIFAMSLPFYLILAEPKKSSPQNMEAPLSAD
jgi:DHA1 family multidrug resistance protein-like MFS transporter